jgi:hypothetical protein
LLVAAAVGADTEVAVDMVAVEVSTEVAVAFMVAWAEVDFVPAVSAEAGHTLRAEALGAAASAEALAAATVTAAMMVDMADTVTTITDQVL